MQTNVNARSWLILIIGIVPWVEGATRLQKYAFLVAQRINNINFYEDWIASDYGPFSPSLSDDLKSLVDDGYIGKHPVRNEFGYKVDRFAPTDKGRNTISTMEGENQHIINKIKEIIGQYHGKSLMTLLADVYRLYPNYTSNSKIHVEVGRRIYESDTYLNPEFDEEAS